MEVTTNVLESTYDGLHLDVESDFIFLSVEPSTPLVNFVDPDLTPTENWCKDPHLGGRSRPVTVCHTDKVGRTGWD